QEGLMAPPAWEGRMEETQLRNFLAVVENGSISRAAQALGVAQPSLSQQVLRLEDELNMRLFKRSTRGVSLTDTGRVFEPHAREIVRSMQRAREHVGAYEAVPHGVVTIIVPSSINQILGTPLTIACRERFPDISLKVQEAASGTMRLTMMAANGVDLTINFCAEKAPSNSGWARRWIADETLLVIGRAGEFGEADSRGVALRPVGADLLNRVNLIVPSTPKPRRLFPGAGGDDSYVFGFRVGIEMDSLSQILELVTAGHGHSLLPHSAVREALLAGRLSAARVDGVELTRSVSLVRNAGKPVTRAILEIEELVFGMLRQMIADGVWITDVRPSVDGYRVGPTAFRGARADADRVANGG
ncbi:MAG: hypothetical protein JWO33_1161, partial [Caulobacteraceae bacterium]|nr:hypothetical protein [Caulobacteraceae bacterium]